jgi:hypothetical protein
MTPTPFGSGSATLLYPVRKLYLKDKLVLKTVSSAWWNCLVELDTEAKTAFQWLFLLAIFNFFVFLSIQVLNK